VSDDEAVTPLWTHEDAAIGERVGRSLRTEPHLPANFDTKVMSAVRVESRVRMRIAARRTPVAASDSIPDASRSWWRRTQRVEITPLAVVAWIIGLALLVMLGALAAFRLMPRQPPAVDAATSQQVRRGSAKIRLESHVNTQSEVRARTVMALLAVEQIPRRDVRA
jgi:hypothetical protein